ncbi:MAG: acetyl-CoA carboxylase biotin carboxyl carrier protein [Firmicutes bacterium]|nr:acetyl-CoA carboxylase biotin carboxyl carrier protein [Bacillota bacterium]
MKIEDIKALVTILEGSSLNYMEISEGDFHLKLGKNVPAATAVETVSPVEAAVPAKSEVAQAPSAPVGGTPVTSPIVGVFYAAPSPEAEAFVTVGQTVKKGQVLCIIEAMKLMNEITAENDGVITEVCVNNGDIVEFGQPLFYIQ